MNHFILYPFWINEVACWFDLKSLNGPVGTENRGVAVFTHRDITQLNESTFDAYADSPLLQTLRDQVNNLRISYLNVTPLLKI